MPSRYIPILIYAILAAAFPAGTLIIFKFIPPDSASAGAKLKPYECGIPPESDARGRHSVRFYILGILFVFFDGGRIFLFSWGGQFKTSWLHGLLVMFWFFG